MRMQSAKRWAIAFALAATAGAALAGEDSSDRWGGFGPAYWETSCGLPCFSPATPEFPAAAEQP
jgi:hypothetical protein